MSKLTKNQKLALGKIEAGKAYTLKEASALVKEITTTKFDASVDVDVRLGFDPRKANQMVRGVVSLPHGTGKQVRVLALCTPDKEAEATAAGADYVGLDEYIEKIKGGWTDSQIGMCQEPFDNALIIFIEATALGIKYQMLIHHREETLEVLLLSLGIRISRKRLFPATDRL